MKQREHQERRDRKPKEHSNQQKRNKLTNYYKQRYQLFSKYDDGILMDEEAWYSVTPEEIALNISDRISWKLNFLKREIRVLDLFCCVGGDTIQQAVNGHLVTSVDIDKAKLEMLKHNAAIYHVDQKIITVHCDVFDYVRNVEDGRYDCVIMSPPWGGPKKDRKKTTLESLFGGLHWLVVECVRKFRNVVLYIPQDMDVDFVQAEVDFPFEVVRFAFGNHQVMAAIVTGVLIHV